MLQRNGAQRIMCFEPLPLVEGGLLLKQVELLASKVNPIFISIPVRPHRYSISLLFYPDCLTTSMIFLPN